MKRAVIIGAGQTGRGFIAPMLSDYKIIFVDKNESLIKQLNEEKSYMIRYFGEARQPVEISNFEAYVNSDKKVVEEIKRADVLIISVFASNIADLVPLLEEATSKRENKLEIICCENGVNVKKPLIDANVDAIVREGIIFCTTLKPSKESLDLLCQDYPDIPVDGGVEGKHADIKGMPLEPRFSDLIQRKIYTYNFISAVVSYLGWYKDYEVYAKAANDIEISYVIDKVVPIISKVVSKEYKISYEIQEEFTLRAVEKFKNKDIYDTIYRNSRQVERKLGLNERLLSPIRFAIKYGEDYSLFRFITAAAIHYGEVEENLNVYKVINDLKSINCDVESVLEYLEKFRNKQNISEII